MVSRQRQYVMLAHKRRTQVIYNPAQVFDRLAMFMQNKGKAATPADVLFEIPRAVSVASVGTQAEQGGTRFGRFGLRRR
eukprot:9641308-Alexandrium_andersonii.AAC.1